VPHLRQTNRTGFLFVWLQSFYYLCIVENLSEARRLTALMLLQPPANQRRIIILTVHLHTLKAISTLIMWKGFAAISIGFTGSPHHLFSLSPDRCNGWGFSSGTLSLCFTLQRYTIICSISSF